MANKKTITLPIISFFTMLISSCGQLPSGSSLPSTTESEISSFISSSEQDPSSSSETDDSSISDSISSEDISLPSSEEPRMIRKNYQNSPYNSDFPDPAGIYDPVQKAWFLYATGGKIIRSYDGVNWTSLPNAFSTIPNWATNGAGLWAPEVQYIAGQYVMYYSLSVWGDPNPAIGVATAPKPEGPWLDRGKLFTSLEIGVNNSIDAGVFVAQNGRVYMIWGSMRGNYIVELTSDGLAFRAGSVEAAAQTKVRIAGLDTATPWNVNTYEGAYVRYWDGYYYLFLSMGTCCVGAASTYQVVVGRSKAPMGPYVDDQGRELTNENVGKVVIAKNDSFVGTGHNSIIDDVSGKPWFYYHGYHRNNDSLGRVLLMDPLHFDENGWPYVSGLESSTKLRTGPYYFE